MAATRPLVVGVTDLIRQPGVRRSIERSALLDGLGISAASVPPGEPVDVALELEAISNAVVATGTVTVPWVGECRRCLQDVHGHAVAEVREVFERRPTEGETYAFDADQLDLEPMVRDAALLALPIAPLCREDCLGPAPEEFPTTVESDELPAEGAPEGEDGDETADESPKGRDPRWAGLDGLSFD